MLIKAVEFKYNFVKQIASNKKVFHEYEIFDKFTAGIVLSGNEIKSVRDGKMTLADSYGIVSKGEIYLLNAQISTYSKAFIGSSLDTRRRRKLLLTAREIKKIIGDVSKKGMTIVPLQALMNEKGFLKIQIGMAKHKKLHNKKRDLKEKDLARQAQRDLKNI